MAEEDMNAALMYVEEETRYVTDDDCKGPNSTYVKLVSRDKKEFFVRRVHAIQSGTLNAMLGGPPVDDNEINVIYFSELSSTLLTTIRNYLVYKASYANCTHEFPEFHIPTEQALDLLAAATFLDV